MKKILLGFVILSLALLTIKGVSAQSRGIQPNIFASWLSVSTTQTRIPLPSAMGRDILIQNGDASNDVCVSLIGEDILLTSLYECVSNGDRRKVFKINAGDSIQLFDVAVSQVTVRTNMGTASPITVISTW